MINNTNNIIIILLVIVYYYIMYYMYKNNYSIENQQARWFIENNCKLTENDKKYEEREGGRKTKWKQ